MARLYRHEGKSTDGYQPECDSPEQPADKGALEEWIAQARAKQADLDTRSFDQRKRWAELEEEINGYLEELFVWVMRGEMDAELA